MQKKLIALAIAAAFSAPVFADTTVYGVVDAAIAHVAADGQKGDTMAVSSGLAGSRIGVTSAEDVGNGLKVVVKLEYALNTEQSVANTTAAGATSDKTNGTSGIGSARQQLVALAGGFGTVATGYLQTTGYDFQQKFDPTGGSTVTPLGNVTSGGKFLIGSSAVLKRAPRAVAYISPEVSGLSGAFNYATVADDSLGNLTLASTAAETKNTAWLASVNYANGPIAAGLVYAKLSTATGTTDKKEYALGGSYDAGVAKISATYQSLTATVANTSGKAYSLSAVIPAGPGAVVASYAKNKMDATAGGLQTSAKGMTLGYLYSLSKTTTIYAAYSKMSQDKGTHAYSVFSNGVAGSGAATWLAGGGSSSQLALGINKKF